MPGTLAIASCSRGSNGVPGSAGIGAHTLALEQRSQLAVDRRHALEPGILGDGLGTCVDGPVEVVGHREHLADEVLTRQTEIALTLLGRPPLEVEELGALALQRDEVLLRLPLRVLELAAKRLDVGEQLGRPDIQIVGALIRAGAMRSLGRGSAVQA